MKKTLFALCIALTAIACNTTPEGYVVNGTLTGEIENGTQVFLKRIDERNQPIVIDTALVENGNFKFTGKTNYPELHYIFIDKIGTFAPIVLENGEIEFKSQKDSLNMAKIKGTKQNEIFNDYIEKSRSISQRAKSIQDDMRKASLERQEETALALKDEMEELKGEYKDFEKNYITNNPSSLIAALLIDRSLSAKVITPKEGKEFYDALTPEIKDTKPGKRILKSLERLETEEVKENNTAVGAKAPDFSGPSPDGKVIALNDVLGKVTLIDFWAAWCKPCRAENPNVVKVYNKYHDKGLNVIGVSLDKKEDAWKKAIADDGLVWHQISNLAYFNDEIAKLYNVNAIPAAFLLDENGVIIAKNLRGPALEAKISELLK